MGQIIKAYDSNTSRKNINYIADILQKGGVIIFPTDSFYSFGCSIDCPKAINELIRLKNKKDKNLSLICSDIKMASKYIKISDDNFLILRKNTPKPITFLFEVNKRLPNSFLECKKTVGIRIVNSELIRDIAETLGVPIVSTTVSLSDSTRDESIDPSLIWDEYRDKIELLIDCGHACGVATTVVDMTGEDIEIIRESEAEINF